MYRRTETIDTEIINILCSRLVIFIIVFLVSSR